MKVNWITGRKPGKTVLNNVDVAIGILKDVRDLHLTTGDGKNRHEDVESHICFAISIVIRRNDGDELIEKVGESLQNWIQRQFGGECAIYERWLMNRGYGPYKDPQKTQASRRAWISHMIQELERSKA